eukprot:s1533_g8.t6
MLAITSITREAIFQQCTYSVSVLPGATNWPTKHQEPQAAEKPRALQGHGLVVSKELGQNLAMMEHEETPPDSSGDLHGRLDEKSALALLRGRADPNAVLGALRRTPLFAAAERCNIKLIDSLLKFRADVNRADLAGETPLFALCHAAAWADASLHSRRAAVQRLLEGEADIDFANPRGRTPLHAAITSGDVAVLSVLLEDAANVNARDLGGFTALMWAAGRGNAEVVKALLTARANTALAANLAECSHLKNRLAGSCYAAMLGPSGTYAVAKRLCSSRSPTSASRWSRPFKERAALALPRQPPKCLALLIAGMQIQSQLPSWVRYAQSSHPI